METSLNDYEQKHEDSSSLVWDQPWDNFIAEVNQAVPNTFNLDPTGQQKEDGPSSPLTAQPDQDVLMNGVVEDWLHESTTSRQPSNPQIWQQQTPPVFARLADQNAYFIGNHVEESTKSAVQTFPAVLSRPEVFQESVSSSTADGDRSRASSIPSAHEDYLSATDTLDLQSRVGSIPSSPKIAEFQCQLCPKTFTRALNLRQHLRGHANDRPYVCKICDRSFARSQDRKRHEAFHFESPSGTPTMSRSGSMASMYSAVSASSSAASRRGLRIPGGYTCAQCNRAFDVPSDLAQHERNHKPKDQRPHACPECDERFLYPKDLGRHVRRKHKAEEGRESASRSKQAERSSAAESGAGPPVSRRGSQEPLPSFESIERVNQYSPSVASSHRTQQSSPSHAYTSSDDPLESLAEVITGIPPGLRNMLFASMQGSEQELKVRLAQVWLGGIEVLLKTKTRPSDERSQRTTQALEQLALDLNQLEMQDEGDGDGTEFKER